MKLRRITGGAILAGLLFAFVYIGWLNPELSQTQMIVRYWPQYAAGLILFLIAFALLD